MKTRSSCVNISVEDIHEPKKMCKAFQDIATYFSEEEWAKRSTWQKSVYVYMKRNYIRMTALGVTVNQPVFMRPKQQAKEILVECIEVHGHESEDEHSEGTLGIKPKKRVKLTSLDLDPQNENEGLASEDAPASTVSTASTASNLPGVTVNQPVFMRPKQQAKEILVECIEVYGHESEDEHSEGTLGIKPKKRVKLTSLDLDPQNENEGLASEDAPASTVSTASTASNLPGVTVNQPVFMRPKQQAKEILVECIEVHGHESEDEHSEGTLGIKPKKRVKLTSLDLDPQNENEGLASEDAPASTVSTASTASNLPGAGDIQVNVWSHRLRKTRKKRVFDESIWTT